MRPSPLYLLLLLLPSLAAAQSLSQIPDGQIQAPVLTAPPLATTAPAQQEAAAAMPPIRNQAAAVAARIHRDQPAPSAPVRLYPSAAVPVPVVSGAPRVFNGSAPTVPAVPTVVGTRTPQVGSQAGTVAVGAVQTGGAGRVAESGGVEVGWGVKMAVVVFVGAWAVVVG